MMFVLKYDTEENNMKSCTHPQPVNCKIDIHPFLLGLSRIFDFTQIINKPGDMTEDEVDIEALRGDWIALGNDLRSSMRSVVGN